MDINPGIFPTLHRIAAYLQYQPESLIMNEEWNIYSGGHM